MKIVTVVGTRPEIIRLSRVITALDRSVEHILIHTGQNYDYELNEIFFNEMGIRKPDFVLGSAGIDSVIHAGHPSFSTIETVANIMTNLEKMLNRIKPEALLILGDTNSCLAAAYVAKRLKIPEGMEEGSVMLTGFNPKRVFKGIEILDRQRDYAVNTPMDYLTPSVSEKVVRILLSYTDYVNRNVWRKNA